MPHHGKVTEKMEAVRLGRGWWSLLVVIERGFAGLGREGGVPESVERFTYKPGLVVTLSNYLDNR